MSNKTKVNVTNKFVGLSVWALEDNSRDYFEDLQEARAKAIEHVESGEADRNGLVIVQIIEHVKVIKPVVEVESCNYEIKEKLCENGQGISIETTLQTPGE